MSQKLYDAVKSGRVKLEDLNEEGKAALRQYMATKNASSSAGASQSVAPTVQMPTAKVEKKLPFLAQVQKDIYKNVIEPVQNKAYRFAGSVADALTLGQGKKAAKKSNMPYFTGIKPVSKSLQPAQTTGDKIADIAGTVAGDLLGIGKLYKLGGFATRKLLPNAGKLTKLIAPGTVAGATYQTGKEALDMALPDEGDKDKTLGDRALNVAGTAAAFAGGDVALRYAGKGIKALSDATGLTPKVKVTFNNLMQRIKSNQTPANAAVIRSSKKDQAITDYHNSKAEYKAFDDDMARKYGDTEGTQGWSEEDIARYKKLSDAIDTAHGKAMSLKISLDELYATPSQANKEVAARKLLLTDGSRAQRIKSAIERSKLKPNETPIAGEGNVHTFELPEASQLSKDRTNNINQGQTALKDITDELDLLKNDYLKAVKDQFDYLKESFKSRQGVTQGNLQRDAEGTVVGRTGRISFNPKWYQDFYQEHGKAPNNKEFYMLAKKQVDEGYQDEAGSIPSWKKENNYDEMVEALSGVKETLQNSLTDISPAIVGRAADPITRVGRAKPIVHPLPPEPPAQLYTTEAYPKNKNAAQVEMLLPGTNRPVKDNVIPLPLPTPKTLTEAVGLQERIRETEKLIKGTERKIERLNKHIQSEGATQKHQEHMAVLRKELAANRAILTNRTAKLERTSLSKLPLGEIHAIPSKQLSKVVLDSASPELWKDKFKPFLIRETMTRNFEDIMGKDAPKMKKIYLEPVAKGESARQRFVKQEKADIRELGVKYKSKEDDLIQRYGEGLLSLDDLKTATPNWQKVVDSVGIFRKKYDDLLNTANTVLERNGYAPIPKRKNYFPHYEEIDDLLSKFGIRLEDHTLPTDVSGLTADFKPGKNFFTHSLKREGNQTTFGVLEGFDRYIEGISKIIHHTDNIKRLRGLETEIRTRFKGKTNLSNFVSDLTDYTNNLAGKKSLTDRGAENPIGRGLYKAIDGLKRRVGANMVGGSISAALTNFIPLTQALATTEKVSFAKGMHGTLQNVIKNDGFALKSNFLSRRETADPLAINLWGKAVDKAAWIFKVVDRFTTHTVVRGKYDEAINHGLSPEDAMDYADDWAARVIGDRSLGATPTLFNSRMLGLVTQFQLEVNNQLSFIFKDIPKAYNKKAAASAIGQVFIYSYLFNELYEQATGFRPAFDPIGITQNAIEDYMNPELSNKAAGGNLYENVSNNLPFSSVLMGGGRIPITAALPNVKALATGEASLMEEAKKPLKYLLPPVGGSQINKTLTGLTDLGLNPLYPGEPGVHQKNPDGEEYLKYPVQRTPANILRGTLFGRSSFPETRQYYRLNERPLSPGQTQIVENSSNPREIYGRMMEERELDKIDDEYDKILDNRKLSREEVNKRVEQLKKRYQEIMQNAK